MDDKYRIHWEYKESRSVSGVIYEVIEKVREITERLNDKYFQGKATYIIKKETDE